MHDFKTALVLGCGRSGRAAEALLRSEDVHVVSVSQESTPEYHYDDLGFIPDAAVVSPGFAPDHPWVLDLKKRGIALLAELELGWSRRHCPVIAVTGSNGKSTAVKWIAEALEQDGKRAVICGNYGLPVCTAVRMSDVPDWLVMEVSSFQLETIQHFRPEIGVLLNLLPNHLDRHGDMETYRRIKFRLFENMTPGDCIVCPAEFFQSLEEMVPTPEKRSFGTGAGADYIFADGAVGPVDVRGTYFDNPVLRPAAAAVAAVGAACGLPPAAVERAARRFEPLPHRLQTVAEIDAVRYIDDSKATNLAAMCAALSMCAGTVHLIAGGRSKETEFSFAKDLLARRRVHLYLIGEASSAMQKAWQDVADCLPCGTLEEAVCAARKRANPGETVLLSPGCTSFDRFSGFEERGECFTRAVCSQCDPPDIDTGVVG